MVNLANCCLLLLPCRITRLRRETYINPKFAKHKHVPQTHLGGTSRCFARPNCRAEHLNVPPGPLQRGCRCFAFFGLGGQGFRQFAAPGRRFCAVCEGLRCATCRYLPLAHRKRPSGGFWWGSLCGCLAKWHPGEKQETESSRMSKLRFCGADEARTRDPRRDRPVF